MAIRYVDVDPKTGRVLPTKEGDHQPFTRGSVPVKGGSRAGDRRPAGGDGSTKRDK